MILPFCYRNVIQQASAKTEERNKVTYNQDRSKSNIITRNSGSSRAAAATTIIMILIR